jgi:hypothetical protein
MLMMAAVMGQKERTIVCVSNTATLFNRLVQCWFETTMIDRTREDDSQHCRLGGRIIGETLQDM